MAFARKPLIHVCFVLALAACDSSMKFRSAGVYTDSNLQAPQPTTQSGVQTNITDATPAQPPANSNGNDESGEPQATLSLEEEEGEEQQDEGDVDDAGDDQLKDSCKLLLGDTGKKIVIAGKHSDATIPVDSVLLFHVAGNQNNIKLTLDTPVGKPLAGLCLIITGNQTRVELNISGQLNQLVYSGAGNRTQGLVQVNEGGRVGSMSVKIRGNLHELNIQGDGQYTCPEGDIEGTGSMVCE